MPIERKLAAIMFTDIAGYIEQMSKSESKSLDILEKAGVIKAISANWGLFLNANCNNS